MEAAVDRLGAGGARRARGSAAAAPAGGRLDDGGAAWKHGGAADQRRRDPRRARRAAISPAARAMLGRDAGVGGRVVHGFHRGGPLGIPTANLRVRGIQLPPDGVYAVRARVGGSALRGVANIGFNPTFGNQTRTVETHLLDFNGDLYGRRLEVAFVDPAARRAEVSRRTGAAGADPRRHRRGAALLRDQHGRSDRRSGLMRVGGGSSRDAAGMRLDRFLTQRDVLGTRSQVQRLIDDGQVRVGDRPIKPGTTAAPRRPRRRAAPAAAGCCTPSRRRSRSTCCTRTTGCWRSTSRPDSSCIPRRGTGRARW